MAPVGTLVWIVGGIFLLNVLALAWLATLELVERRRLNKEIYFINYNNDVHNPASRANQKDIAARMQQFFDNKLKGQPAPKWMIEGIPAKDKGRDQLQIQVQSAQSQNVVPQ